MSAIRPLHADDAPALFAAVDRSRPELARWMEWYHADYALADAEEWVQQCLSQRAAGTDYHFAVCDADRRVIGAVSLENVTFPGPRAMLGYWVATPSTGRGIATAAVKQILAWAETHSELRLVWAMVAPGNVGSRRVLEANGFRLAAAGSYQAHEGSLTYDRMLTRSSHA